MSRFSILSALFVSIAFSTPSFAAATFICSGMGDARGNSVTLTLLTPYQVQVDGDLAVLDRNFNPRLNLDLLRYEYQQSEEGVTEVLVQEALLEGAGRGLIKIQNRGEGFSSEEYYCLKRAA